VRDYISLRDMYAFRGVAVHEWASVTAPVKPKEDSMGHRTRRKPEYIDGFRFAARGVTMTRRLWDALSVDEVSVMTLVSGCYECELSLSSQRKA